MVFCLMLSGWPIYRISRDHHATFNQALLLFSSNILQKYYIKLKVRRIKDKRKHGVDPIKTAFEQMKVKTWQLIIFCLHIMYYSYLGENCKALSCLAEGEETTDTIEELC